MVAVRSLALVSFLLVFPAVASVPGCGCEVSHCCKTFRGISGDKHSALEALFAALPGEAGQGYSYEASSGNEPVEFDPACSFLWLIPGAFEEGGICSEIQNSTQGSTLCEAISANEKAKNRLSSGRSILSIFREPGSCAQLEGDVCWKKEAGRVIHTWDSSDSRQTICQGHVVPETPTVAYKITCLSEGLIINAKWVDGKKFESCEGNYSGGLQVTVGANDWATQQNSEGSPRWRCFDVPRETMGTKDHRIVAYSIGDVPCIAEGTTITTTGSESSTGYCTKTVMLSVVATCALLAESLL